MFTSNRLVSAVAGSLLMFSMAAGAATAPASSLPAVATHQNAADTKPATEAAKPENCKAMTDAKEKAKCHEAAKAAKAAKSAKTQVTTPAQQR